MMSNIQNKRRLAFFLDAATPLFYIAFKNLNNGFVVGRQYKHEDLKGEALLFEVKKLMSEQNYTIDEIVYLCTTQGPGSLTGLRIVMSILKTMAQILSVPIVCIPTLFALEKAYRSNEESENIKTITLLTARKNSYYVRFSGSQKGEFEQLSSKELCEQIKNVNLLIWPTGSSPLISCDNKNVNSVIVRLCPDTVFDLCASQYQKGEYQNYIDCTPEYAGKSVAEKNFEKSKKNGI